MYFLSAISFRIRTYGDSTYVHTSFLQSLSAYVHTAIPHTYIRRSLIPYYDSGPLHKHQIYVRPIFHFVPLVESGICLLVDLATLSTIYDVRHPLLLPRGYPTQELISRPQAVRHPSSTPTLAACISFLHYSTLLSIAHIYHLKHQIYVRPIFHIQYQVCNSYTDGKVRTFGFSCQ